MQHSKLCRIAAIIALIGTPVFVTAQTGTTATAPTSPTVGTSDTVTTKLTNQFSSFAGSPENANALVTGLRTGSSITLTSPPPSTGGTIPTTGSTIPTTTTFTPPTKPMGYGNIKIAMSLAQANLASQGITNPTPQQLQGALIGTTTTVNGVTTQTQGVLQMRADGMGWGKIANTMGYKLGAVMSGRALTPTTTAAGVSTVTTHGKPMSAGSRVTTGGSTTGAGHSKGIVTGASGTSGGASLANSGRGNAYGHGSKGIVTAAGVSNGSGAVTAMGHGAGGRSGIVTASAGAGSGKSNGNAGKSGGKP